MLLYSILVPIIAIIFIASFLIRTIKGKSSILTLILWTILWIIVSLFAIFPHVSSHFAKLFGITRGLDFVIIVVFAVLVYTIFKLYLKLDNLQDDVNKIVKEVALQNEISLDDEED